MSVKSNNVINDGLIFNIDGGINKSAGQVLHAFTGSGTFTPSQDLDVEFLIVAGGGSGGNDNAGGAGAGGYVYGKRRVTSGTAYTITVGAGAGVNSSGEAQGSNGNNSSAMGFTAVGGGGGGGGDGGQDGGNGGSGGGCGGEGQPNIVGTGIPGQGFPGGREGSVGDGNGGGGGGAGGPGGAAATGTVSQSGNGGPGKYFGNRFGTNYGENGWFAGGGAGAVGNGPAGTAPPADYGNGGIGGGGDHGKNAVATYVGESGAANTGGGGAGGAYTGAVYGNGGGGGSGIVLITYTSTIARATGGTITNTRGSNGVTDAINGHNGSKINCATVSTAGKGSFDFDGTNDGIEFAHNNDFNSPYFTIDVWVKFDVNTSPSQLVAKRTDAQNGTYWLYFNGSGTLMADHYRSGVQQRLNCVWSPSTGVWYNVCYSLNPSLKLVTVNGASINSQNLTNHATDQNSAILRVGLDSIGTNTYPLNGQIASVRIYNYGLTLSEIQQNFAATKKRFGY